MRLDTLALLMNDFQMRTFQTKFLVLLENITVPFIICFSYSLNGFSIYVLDVTLCIEDKLALKIR